MSHQAGLALFTAVEFSQRNASYAVNRTACRTFQPDRVFLDHVIFSISGRYEYGRGWQIFNNYRILPCLFISVQTFVSGL